MKKYILVVGLIVSTNSYSTPPYQTTKVKEFQSGQIPKDIAKYRIVISDSFNNNSNISLKNLTLCSSTKCYNSSSTKNINVKNMLDGQPSKNSLTYLIPRSETIKTIYFEPILGIKNTISGSIRIENPTNLNITNLPHNVDIFVSLTNKNNSLIPEYASSMFNTAEAKNVFYDKNIGIKSNLDYGAILNIPKNALQNSQIFNIFVNNDESKYPSVDIYPKVNFTKPIELIRKPIDDSLFNDLAEAFNVKMPKLATTASTNLKKSDTTQSQTIDNNTISIHNSGFIPSSDLTDNTTNNARSSVSLASTETCSAELARLSKQLISQTSTSGVVNIDLCKNKPPYVHIALINKLHPKIGYLVEHDPTTIDPFDTLKIVLATPMHKLQYFNNNSPSAIVSINGFTWDGPPGIIPNTFGRSLGYVSSSKTYDRSANKVKPIGINRKLGGTVLANAYPGTDDGNKFIMHHVLNSPNVSFFESKKILGAFSGGMENVVSSSTSILKNNVCNSGNTDRWSSVGAINSIMVMISTASDKESNSADFCSIYRAFGITNALRLDGGGSTGMIINNKLMNPNTGSKRVVFGEMRYIPYALKIYGK